MAPAIATSPRAWKPRRLLALAAAGVSALMAAQWLQELQPQCFAGATVKVAPRARAVARAAEEEGEEAEPEEKKVNPFSVLPRPKWKGTATCKTYDDFTFIRSKRQGNILRLDKWGRKHQAFYRILATKKGRFKPRHNFFYERVGWWDPHREVRDPKFFSVRCDRVCHWLRQGHQPTDMVASLLDRAGIIRRTGPHSKLGQWEWRVPENSGPEAPEGWKYDGPHVVTWNNRPRLRIPEKVRKRGIPLIEKYGFVGYKKIPIDEEAAEEPLVDKGLMKSFDNVMLPGFEQGRYYS